MSITLAWWMIVLDIFGVIFAFFLGWKFAKTHHEGIVRIETNDDDTRDVIRFILDFDLDWVRTQKSISFKVEDLSQNSHPRK